MNSMRSAGIRIKKSVTKAACTADKVVKNHKNHLYFSCWRKLAVVVAVVVAGEVGGGGGVGGG